MVTPPFQAPDCLVAYHSSRDMCPVRPSSEEPETCPIPATNKNGDAVSVPSRDSSNPSGSDMSPDDPPTEAGSYRVTLGEGQDRYMIVAAEIAWDPELSAHEVRAYLRLRTLAVSALGTSESIAEALGMGERQAKSALKALRAGGWVTWEAVRSRGAGGKWRTLAATWSVNLDRVI